VEATAAALAFGVMATDTIPYNVKLRYDENKKKKNQKNLATCHLKLTIVYTMKLTITV